VVVGRSIRAVHISFMGRRVAERQAACLERSRGYRQRPTSRARADELQITISCSARLRRRSSRRNRTPPSREIRSRSRNTCRRCSARASRTLRCSSTGFRPRWRSTARGCNARDRRNRCPGCMGSRPRSRSSGLRCNAGSRRSRSIRGTSARRRSDTRRSRLPPAPPSRRRRMQPRRQTGWPGYR
jgi:hypothetical protein